MIDERELQNFSIQLADLRIQLSMLTVDPRCLSDDDFGRHTHDIMTKTIKLENQLKPLVAQPLRFDIDLTPMTSVLEKVNEVVAGILSGSRANDLYTVSEELERVIILMPDTG